MPQFVEVRFKGNRKELFTWDQDRDPTVGNAVVVEVERGRDLGHVSAVGEAAQRKCGVGCDGCELTQPKAPRGKILRTATSEDAHLSDELRKAEEDVRRTVIERVLKHGLVMKVSDAEWQWDRRKLTVYFTAEKRVDFRALVRDLASLFRTRIELRQIGARDEAKRLDGVGRCGRQYCCSSWLPELKPVSLSLAKDQSLSLNPSQISGGCGRLLCCLRYEHDFYASSRKRFPKEGRTIPTARGHETVVSVDIFRERIFLRASDNTTRAVTLVELKEEVTSSEGTRSVAPAKPKPEPPAADASDALVTTQDAIEAVTPAKPRRKKRRGRRGKRGPQRGTDKDTPQDDGSGSTGPGKRS